MSTIKFDTIEVIIDIIKNETREDLSSVLTTIHRNDINKLSPHGIAPIHYACLEGDLEMVECLLEHNADPSVQDIEGWTPLHIAAATNNYQLVFRLLAAGADPCLLNNDHETASDVAEEEEVYYLLDTSAEERRSEMEESLAETQDHQDLDLDQDEEEALLTALKQAHKHKHNVSEWEEKLGISEEASILHLATAYGYSRLVKYICEEGVLNVDTRDSDGWTPLHVASYWQESEIEELLLSHGANPHLTTKLYYNTPSDLQTRE